MGEGGSTLISLITWVTPSTRFTTLSASDFNTGRVTAPNKLMPHLARDMVFVRGAGHERIVVILFVREPDGQD
jgi:hypothetical protein